VRSLLVVLLFVPALAAAKPLPAGMTFGVASNHLTVSQSGVTVTLGTSVGKLVKTELSDDGKTLLVTSTMCNGSVDDEKTPIEIPFAAVQAQLENALGMKSHLKKQYADAILHFAAAVKLDPMPVYETNLLSAQSLGGKLADADQTIATYAPANLPWFVWRLAVDSDLAPLAGRPSTKLGPTKRGTVKSAKLGSDVAYSPLGLVATENTIAIWNGIPDGSANLALMIVDIKTGKELLRLPTENICALDMAMAMSGVSPAPPADKKCPKAEAAAAVPRRKAADAVLASLGFELVPKAVTAMSVDGNPVPEVTATDGRKFVNDDHPHVIAGKKRVEVDPFARLWSVAFVPGGFVMWHRGDKHIDACGADGPYDNEIATYATP
jgi:hypothetical protein